MIRALIITAIAGFVLAIACFAGAAALGGRELFEHGWTVLPAELWADDENVHISIGEAFDPDQVPDLEPATNTTDEEPATNATGETPPPEA
jgi:hypothetical protein